MVINTYNKMIKSNCGQDRTFENFSDFAQDRYSEILIKRARWPVLDNQYIGDAQYGCLSV